MVLLVPQLAAAAATTVVDWGRCPPGQSGNDCASLQLLLDPTDPTKGNVTGFVRRFYSGSTATANSLWMFAGGPGDSAEAFSGGAEYFLSVDPTVTVYLMDQRGVGRSSPVDCSEPPLYPYDAHNATIVAAYDGCNADVAAKYGKVVEYYSTYYAALDYKAAVEAINPDKVAIYALSFGTYALNSYLLVGGRADVLVS